MSPPFDDLTEKTFGPRVIPDPVEPWGWFDRLMNISDGALLAIVLVVFGVLLAYNAARSAGWVG